MGFDLVVTSNLMVNSMERNSEMLSIGQLARKADVTTRTLRFYEAKGLIPKARRIENNYRACDDSLLSNEYCVFVCSKI